MTKNSPISITSKDFWIDTRLNQEEMDFLWGCISEENKQDYSRRLAGNISMSELIIDKDNWFFNSALKRLTEKMFYRDWDNYYKYHIEVEEGTPLPKFKLTTLWVNYQKQHEFNPLHFHTECLYSFVIFVKIPTHWKEQHALPISANSNSPHASDFAFVWSDRDTVVCETLNILLSPEDEGRILFFPAWVKHQVYPFYECEEERITISGNINFVNLNHNLVYEDKRKMLKKMENSVKFVKNELKQMEKEMEKEGSN